MAGRRDIKAGKAYVEMYVRNADLIKGLRKASMHLKTFGAGMQSIGVKMLAAGGIMAAPFLLAVKSFAQAGDTLDKMSARVGVSVEFLSKLGHAAELGGSSIQDMEKGIRRMQRTALDADRGLSTAVDTFTELGISATDSGGAIKGTEALFMESVYALSKVENETRKAALAQMLFGRAGTQLLPMLKDGKAGMMAAMEEAKKLGIVMSTEDATAAAVLTDAFTKLSSVWKMIKVQVGAALAPMFSDMFDSIVDNTKAVIDWVKENKPLIVSIFKIAVGIAASGAAITMLGTAIVGIGAVMASAAAIISGLGTAIGMVTAALGAILSPIGLVIAGVSGLVAYFLWASDSITGVLDWLRNGFDILKKDALAAFSGISDALAAGDMKLAAKIFWAFLKVEWTRGSNAIKGIWDSLAGDWQNFTLTLAKVWVKFEQMLAGSWARISDGITTALAKPLSKAAMTSVVGGNSKDVINQDWLSAAKNSPNAFQSISPGKVRRMIMSDLKPNFDDLNQEAKDAIASAQKRRLGAWQSWEENGGVILDDMAKQRQQTRTKAEQKRAADAEQALGILSQQQKERRGPKAAAAMAAAQSELDAAKKELDDLVIKAKDRREQSKLGDGKGKPGKTKAPGMPGVPSAAAIGGTAVGTFSASQAGMLGGGLSLAERTYRQALYAGKTYKEILAINKKMYQEQKKARTIRATI